MSALSSKEAGILGEPSASGQVIQVQQLTSTQLAAEMKTGIWRQLGTQDGETQYSYTTTVSGKTVRHIVWDSTTGMSYEKAELAKALPGVPIDIWKLAAMAPWVPP